MLNEYRRLKYKGELVFTPVNLRIVETNFDYPVRLAP